MDKKKYLFWRINSFILFCIVWFILLCGTVFAENSGDIIGKIYSTDIVAYIDNAVIKSYNIGGRTVIPIEDLIYYGFEINWDGENRILSANISIEPESLPDIVVSKQHPGNVVGNIYYSDIVTYLNGIECRQTYNIGGVTCIAIEDLGIMNSQGRYVSDYSNYGMRYTYNDDERTIRLYTLRPNSRIETEYGTATVTDIHSNYANQLYVKKNDTSDNPMIYNVFSIFSNAKWNEYISLNELLSNGYCNYSIGEDGLNVTGGLDKKLLLQPYGASNGATQISCVALGLMIPIQINNLAANAECVVKCDRFWNNEIYISIDFLNKYFGFVITAE